MQHKLIYYAICASLIITLLYGVILFSKDSPTLDQPPGGALTHATILLPPPTPLPPPPAAPVPPITPYGKVTIKVGETVRFSDNTIKLVRIASDSRCAEGVTCIWAGTLLAEIESKTGMGTSHETIELGKTMTTDSDVITLLSASPYPKAGSAISADKYVLTFEVVKRKTVVPAVSASSTEKQSACYVGGCSGEVCSDSANAASNCIYKEEFACYKKAVCARQASGNCGWTDTPELRSCLAK